MTTLTQSPNADQTLLCEMPVTSNASASLAGPAPIGPLKKTFWTQVLLVLGLIALALPFAAAIFFAAP